MTISSVIGNLFGRSPILPLQTHMKQVVLCVEELIPFVNAVMVNDWNKAQGIQLNIVQHENEADTIKKDLRLHLPKSLFLPVARTDVLELLTVQDSIANKAKDIAGIILGRKMNIPQEIAGLFVAYLERAVDASRQACTAISELNELLETGFRGNEITLVEEMINKLDKIEHETDEMQVKIRQKLFEIEKTLSPVDAVFFYKILDWVGDLADRAQKVGGHLETLMAY